MKVIKSQLFVIKSQLFIYMLGLYSDLLAVNKCNVFTMIMFILDMHNQPRQGLAAVGKIGLITEIRLGEEIS